MFRIKICGVTTAADALAAIEAGADAIGLNFFPGSPRFVDPAAAAEIAAMLPPGVQRVGVFVDPDADDARRRTRELGLDLVQAHFSAGPIRPARFELSRLVVALRFSRARLAECESAVKAWAAAGELPAAVLVDADREGLHGGTGEPVDWTLARQFRSEHPELAVWLAGGLSPANVRTAVAEVAPEAVDVASGVESAPGKKDAARMRAFVAEALAGLPAAVREERERLRSAAR